MGKYELTRDFGIKIRIYRVKKNRKPKKIFLCAINFNPKKMVKSWILFNLNDLTEIKLILKHLSFLSQLFLNIFMC